MSEKSNASYRANIRLNRVEYADLVTDIESFPESERPARLRMILRVGYSALRGPIVPAASEPSPGQAKVVQTFSAERQLPAQPVRGGLDSHGIDPANFQFGTPS
jgi:hypothetical protein